MLKLQHVLNLPSVHREAGQLVQLFRGELVRLWGAGELVLPHGAAGLGGKLGVLEGDVNARTESGVNFVAAVGGQE